MFDHLSIAARAQIWKNFVVGLGDSVELTDADLSELADEELNGRQIKSAIKTASILAASEKSSLKLRHLKVVIGMRKKASKALSSP